MRRPITLETSSYGLKWLTIALLLSGVSGCSSKGLADSDFCRQHYRNVFDHSDGQSSSIKIALTGDYVIAPKSVVIQYVAKWDSGSAELHLDDMNGKTVWREPIEQTDSPVTVTVPRLPPNTYLLVNVVKNGANGVICMTAAIK